MKDLYKNSEVTSLLFKARHETTSNSLLDRKSIFRIFSTVAAFLITVEQFSDFLK